MSPLDGRVAFITGAARGQGRSHAVRLAGEGANIIGIDICADIASNGYPLGSRDELDATVSLVEAAGGKMLGTVADVRDFYAVKSALDAGVEHFGRLDIVLANAGIATMAFRELTIEEELEQWTDVLDVNLVGAFHTAKAAIPHLITGGRPVYLYDIFQKRSAFPGTDWPFSPDRLYCKGDCPVAEAAFDRWITMHVYEHYTERDIDEIALGVGKVAHHFAQVHA